MDIFEDIEGSDDDRDILNYLYPTRDRKTREIRERPDNFSTWDDNEFWKRYRLKKDTVSYLLSLIEDKIKHQTNRNQCVSPMQQLLLTLRFYATGSFYITVGDYGGVHNSTLCKIVRRVTEAICSLRARYISLPQNRDEILSLQQAFYAIARFPRVIAALDCSHVKIISPGGDSAEHFRNRKGFFSLNVQAMCSSELQFLDIVARWPGSTHDSLIFSNSSAKYKFDNSYFGNGIILGDSGYFLNHYLLTPLSNPQTQAEQLYNESHIRTRNVIERTFGVWKRRFPVLSIGLRCRIPLAQDVIVATAILHNLTCKRNEGEPPTDTDVQIPPEPMVMPVHEQTEDTAGNTTYTRDTLLTYFESLSS